MEKPVIFLDFDGVTHPIWDKQYFHHDIIDRIDQLRRKYDAQVVVSSNWRDHYAVPELEEMIAAQSRVRLPLFEHTPGTMLDEKKHTRGAMIKQFLEQRSAVDKVVARFVILDDLPIWHFKDLEKNIVSVDGDLGFSVRDYERADELLAGHNIN